MNNFTHNYQLNHAPMNIIFNIDYRTVFGEEVMLNIMPANGITGATCRMTTSDGARWTYTFSGKLAAGTSIDYFYSVNKSGVETRCEWKLAPHRIDIACAKGVTYTAYDHWTDIPEDAYLYTSAFTDCIYGHKVMKPAAVDYASTLCVKVRAPQLRRNERLVLVGDEPALGGWDINKALPMTEHSHNEWTAMIDARTLGKSPVELKFVAINEKGERGPMWEDSMNRSITVPQMNDGDVLVLEMPQAFFRIWDAKCAGTLVPVFSLRSERSFGVGDFGDLKLMIDFMSATGQRILQVLPINDTSSTRTWTDSYPYSAISIFALHPQFADLNALPPLSDEKQRTHFDNLREELNAMKQIDYERVNEAKEKYLRLLFTQIGKKTLASAHFKKFFTEQQQWLVPYAQYCSLRDKYKTCDFSKWEGHEKFNEADRKPLASARTAAYKEVAFYYFVQYILDSQMTEVHDYAKRKGIILKGDIPIGVNRHSCDVWQEPQYFNLDGQAGAPPDSFSVNGQNWGFPTYNWEEMLKDGCLWWERRFKNMARFFDAFRIDHVLGFFRIWEIPANAVHGLLGQFSPALGMTREEIEGYGLHFQEELFTRPFITDWVLERMFGKGAGYIRETFLSHRGDGYYDLKTEYDTQRKVEAWYDRVAGQPSGNDDAAEQITKAAGMDLASLRDSLYSLISDVLFVRDRKAANKYHPRISVQHDFVYESLYDNDKFVFNKLYNDYYYRRNSHFWYREAMKKLPKLVQATRMLACAEDLGMVPDCVPWVMNELRILSLEIQSMPKAPNVRFGHLSRNPYRSVCTISSHDMPTLRQWWDEDQERTQEYYNTMLYRSGPAPHPLPGWLARDIISRHLTSPSMLCILSIQDWLAIDEKLRLPDANAERINIPANPHHYWRYRMHVNIESLIANKSFCNKVRELVDFSGRGM